MQSSCSEIPPIRIEDYRDRYDRDGDRNIPVESYPDFALPSDYVGVKVSQFSFLAQILLWVWRWPPLEKSHVSATINTKPT